MDFSTIFYAFRFLLTSDVDDNVVNIDFLNKDTQQLFGLAKNKKSRMRSDDGGFSWCAIPDVEYEMAMADVNQIIGVILFILLEPFSWSLCIVPFWWYFVFPSKSKCNVSVKVVKI